MDRRILEARLNRCDELERETTKQQMEIVKLINKSNSDAKEFIALQAENERLRAFIESVAGFVKLVGGMKYPVSQNEVYNFQECAWSVSGAIKRMNAQQPVEQPDREVG